MPVPETPSTSLDVTLSPTTNVPTICVKNNSVTLNTPDWNVSTLFTIPVPPDCWPVTLWLSKAETGSSVNIRIDLSFCQSPDDGFNMSCFGV